MSFIFERFTISKLAFGIDSINSLYSIGKTSGLVVDSGDSFTRVLPIFEGHIDENKIWQLNWAGRHVSDLIKKKLITEERNKIES